MSERKSNRPQSNRPRNKNQRVCFRALVPSQLQATAVLRLGESDLRLPIIELSLQTDGQSGGLRLGPPGPAGARLKDLKSGDPLDLHIVLPDEPSLPADGTFLRWLETPRLPILRYRLRDRRAEETLRHFWAECQRYYLKPV